MEVSRRVDVGLGVLLWWTVWITSTSVAHPTLLVTYTSSDGTVCVGHPVEVNARHSYNLDGPLFFHVDWGDGTPSIHNSTASQWIHVFQSPGRRGIVVTATDRADEDYDTVVNAEAILWVDVEESPESSDSLHLVVWATEVGEDPTPPPFDIVHRPSVVMRPQQQYTLFVQVAFFHDLSLESRISLTRRVSILGGKPTLQFSGAGVSGPDAFERELHPVVRAWYATIVAGPSHSSLVAWINLPGIVGPTYVDVTVTLFPSYVAPLVEEPPNITTVVPSSRIIISNDQCSLNSAICYMGRLIPGSTIVVLTEDTFGPRWTRAMRFDGLSALFETTESVTVYDGAFGWDRAVVLTSAGILAAVPNSSGDDVAFFRVTTGCAGLDDADPATCLSARFVPGSMCIPYNATSTGDDMYIIVGGGDSGVPNVLLHSSEIEHTDWSQLALPSDMVSDGLEMLSVYRDQWWRLHVILAAAPNGTRARTVLLTESGQGSLAWQFPPDAVVLQLVGLTTGVDLFALGSCMWYSIDVGRIFHRVVCWEGEEYAVMLTSEAGGGYAVLTNMGRVVYGRVGSLDVVPVPSGIASYQAHPHHPNLAASFIKFGQNGILYRVEIPCDTPEALASALAEPAAGFTRTVLPVQAALRAQRKALGAPASICGGLLLFPARESEPPTWCIGQILDSASLTDPIAAILDVTEGPTTNTAQLCMDRSFPAVPLSASPALAGSLYIPDSETTLVLSSEDESTKWLYTDVGKTVLAGAGCYLVERIVNKTHAEARVVVTPWRYGVFASGTWTLNDLRTFRERAAVDVDQVLTVTEATGDNVFYATISSGFFTFGAEDKNCVLFLLSVGEWGVVYRVENDTSVLVTAAQTLTPGYYGIGEWSLYAQIVERRIDNSIHPDSSKEQVWYLRDHECLYYHFTDCSLWRPTVFLDQGMSYNFTVAIAPSGLDPFVAVYGQDVISVDTTVTSSTFSGAPTTSYNYHITERSVKGFSSLMIRAHSSLRCTNYTAQVNLIVGCAPSRHMELTFNYSASEWLYGTPEMRACRGLSAYERLPVNYRPPSSLGRAVPTADNIYNADPSKPRHNDIFSASKSTGSFKQCAGKANREECGCTDVQRYSQNEADSDCIDRVYRVEFESVWAPSFHVAEDDRPSTPLSLAFHVEELNGRTDYCVTGPSSGCASDVGRARSFVLRPGTSDGIQFRGGELYHFRATVEGGTYCPFSAEFLVYVIHEPVESLIKWVSIAATASALALAIFAMYYHHFKVAGPRFLPRDFVSR